MATGSESRVSIRTVELVKEAAYDGCCKAQLAYFGQSIGGRGEVAILDSIHSSMDWPDCIERKEGDEENLQP